MTSLEKVRYMEIAIESTIAGILFTYSFVILALYT